MCKNLSWKKIPSDRTHNFVHGMSVKYNMKCINFKHEAYTHRIFYKSSVCLKISQHVTICVADDRINLCRLLHCKINM